MTTAVKYNGVEEEDMDGELEGELPHIFQESMVEMCVDEILFEIEIDDTLRQLSEARERQPARQRRDQHGGVPGALLTVDLRVFVRRPGL